MSSPTDFYFPPRALCNFVVHYDSKAFHVHDLVLAHHSGYFRKLLESKKRQHEDDPKDTRCINLSPISCLEADVEDACGYVSLLHVFSYMYFREQWFAPPLSPINTEHQEESKDSPFSNWDDITEKTLGERCKEAGAVRLVGVVSIVKFLDCTLLRDRIDHTLSHPLIASSRATEDKLRLLIDAETFDLQETKKGLLRYLVVASDWTYSQAWKDTSEKLSKQTVLEILHAVIEYWDQHECY